MATMWSSVLTLLEAGGEFLQADAITGAMMVLIERLNSLGVQVSRNRGRKEWKQRSALLWVICKIQLEGRQSAHINIMPLP